MLATLHRTWKYTWLQDWRLCHVSCPWNMQFACFESRKSHGQEAAIYILRWPPPRRRTPEDVFFSTSRQQGNEIFAFCFISAWWFCSPCRAMVQFNTAHPFPWRVSWGGIRKRHCCGGSSVVVRMVQRGGVSQGLSAPICVLWDGMARTQLSQRPLSLSRKSAESGVKRIGL